MVTWPCLVEVKAVKERTLGSEVVKDCWRVSGGLEQVLTVWSHPTTFFQFVLPARITLLSPFALTHFPHVFFALHFFRARRISPLFMVLLALRFSSASRLLSASSPLSFPRFYPSNTPWSGPGKMERMSRNSLYPFFFPKFVQT